MAFPPDIHATNRCLAAIRSVNLDTNTYGGWNPQVGPIAIQSNVQTSGNINIPVVGEQWFVERISGLWYLLYKTDFNDPRAQIPNAEGLDVMGSAVGPTYITGDPVKLPAEVYLGEGQIRINTSGVLQIKPYGGDWTTVTGSGGGAGGPITVADITATGTRSASTVLWGDGRWAEVPAPVLPTTASAPHRASILQTLGARAVGSGQAPDGIRPGPCTFTEVTYDFGTADASGSTTVELRKNGVTLSGSSKTVTAANQAPGSGTEVARTATGSWSFVKADILTVHITAVGTTPGSRLTAHALGTVVVALS